MKKTVASVLTALCLLGALASGLCAMAELDYTDADRVIKLHNQYQGYQPTGGLRGGAQGYYDARSFQIQNGKYWCWWGNVYGVDCLEQGGCHAFAFSHAVQWRLQQNLGDAVLFELIDVCENPSDYSLYHGYPKCAASAYPHTSSFEAYSRLCEEKYALTCSREDVPERNEDAWLRFFFFFKTAILLVDGHYNTAVDYLEYEGKRYVQILDSASNAGVTRTWGRAYMAYNHKKLFNLGTPVFGYGPMQYWVEMSDFLPNYISVDAVLTGGVWTEHAGKRLGAY